MSRLLELSIFQEIIIEQRNQQRCQGLSNLSSNCTSSCSEQNKGNTQRSDQARIIIERADQVPKSNN